MKGFINWILAPLAGIAVVIWLFLLGGYDLLRYGRHYIEDRTAVWQDVVTRELPLGSTAVHIRGWADERSFTVYQTSDRKTVEIVVEVIPWHQVVCKEWKIIVDIQMENESSVRERVVSMGACL